MQGESATDRHEDEHQDRAGLLNAPYRPLTLGLTLSVTVVAFLWLGVTTVMPSIAAELEGLSYYGWAFTGFMLANMVAAATVGPWADRTGPRQPFLVAMAVFLFACCLAASAPTWGIFLAARSLQGFGVGGVLTIVYLTVGLRYPDRMRARMLALIASCWTVPALAGPVVIAALASALSWRAVFVAFVPLTILAALPAIPGLRGPGSGGSIDYRQLSSTLVLAIGAALLLVGLESSEPIELIVLAPSGALLLVGAIRYIMPAGFLSFRKGAASAIWSRGLVSAGYYGSEAFVPLAFTATFGFSTLGAGLGLAVGAVTWVVGAWLQAKLDTSLRFGSRGSRAVLGFCLLTGGLGMVAASMILDSPIGPWLAISGWGLGGFGMGLTYPSVTTLALAQVPDREKGAISGNLQLSETLCVAIVVGVAGAISALNFDGSNQNGSIALVLVFLLTAGVGLLGLAPAARSQLPAGRDVE